MNGKTYGHHEKIGWNNRVKMIIADVDETIAAVYKKTAPDLIFELDKLLREEKSIFFITGAGLQSVRERITDMLLPELRWRTLIGNCMGAELWGFEKNGVLKSRPYYSVYEEKFDDGNKTQWRQMMKQIIGEFRLKTFPTMPPAEFRILSKADPLSVLYADRGSQITLEFVNANNLLPEQVREIEKEIGVSIPQTNDVYDLRYAVANRARQLIEKYGLPLYCHMGGTFALDFVIEGVDKTWTIRHVVEDDNILGSFGLSKNDIALPENIECWGDKFVDGPDFLMSLAFPPQVRSINFRDQDPAKLDHRYNIQFWQGKKRLQDGVLEYLQSKA